ncbi:hypothetical protein JOD45_002194 [Scopulibacillus daqui]|uniref:Outer surface protein n=1 Tax=Scopulibacillus daqui TaxID=1469162 RepID=A0ABS2Q115_9BACL|nr:MupG family TIM beta-alpha barrel fold protein [Scopulibacillus daqui]MBM7645969.1 hypothetical protein [Scopulibacillus daqui]
MLGISIYLNNKLSASVENFIKAAKQHGFEAIFTSLHIPEDDPSQYREQLQTLGQLSKEHGMILMADISPKSMAYLGLSFTTACKLANWGVDGIRIDYGIDEQTVIRLSQQMRIALNASTITEPKLDQLAQNGLNTDNTEAWHNFYPRPETGLGKAFLIEKNQLFHRYGLQTMAFIPGDQSLRGPLFHGLPTLEKHRTISPFAAYLELVQSCGVDKVHVGDPYLSQDALIQFANWQKDRTVTLRAWPYLEKELRKTVLTHHTNRLDPARDCLRSAESRTYAIQNDIKYHPYHITVRPRGAVTIDNRLYGRYAGELQITLTDLPKDGKVNVIGQIIDEDLPLLEAIEPGGKFKIKWIETSI